jgi:hypothetical protein
MSSPSSPGTPPAASPESPSPGTTPGGTGSTAPPTEASSGTSQQTKFDIGEEYGTARKNLPPAGILAICIAVVAVIVLAYALTHRAHALSTGTIDDVVAVPVSGQDMVMVAINISLQSNSEKPSLIHTIQAAIETPTGKFTDEAAPAVDAQRYFQVFPALKQNTRDILVPETRINPGSKISGTIIVSFPVTADAFNARKSLTVTVAPYDEVPVVITK